MQAVILAGGFGTRLAPFSLNHPKAMFPVAGRPFLDHILMQISSWGLKKVVLLLGYRAEEIIGHIKQSFFPNLNIEIQVTPAEFGTGARLRNAASAIDEDFILLYCDNYCPIPFEKLKRTFEEGQSLIQVTAYDNPDGYTKNNLLVKDGQVYVYDKNRTTLELNAVDIGYAMIKREVLDWLPMDFNLSFERFCYEKALSMGRLNAWVTGHRYYSIGSYARLERTERFFSRRKAVFLDRDGTLNVRPERAHYVEKPEDFVWLPGAREAVKLLKDEGYLVFLVTNQPGIARGFLTWDMLERIHEKMQGDLNKLGCGIDRIYVCPHGWDEGCSCRKPRPGLLYQTQREFDLNIPDDCVLFGDDSRDIECANSADCQAFMVSDNCSLLESVRNFLKMKRRKERFYHEYGNIDSTLQ